MAKTRNNKKLLLGLCVSIFVMLGILGAYLFTTKNNPSESVENGSDFGKVDYSPAGNEDKAYNNQIKEELGKTTATETPSGSAETAEIVITDANQYGQDVEVRAFISNVIQNNGTCTLTFTGPGTKVVKNVAASADASTTRCENSVIPTTSFDKKGIWQLVVSYSSTNSVGQSEPKNIEIK